MPFRGAPRYGCRCGGNKISAPQEQARRTGLRADRPDASPTGRPFSSRKCRRCYRADQLHMQGHHKWAFDPPERGMDSRTMKLGGAAQLVVYSTFKCSMAAG